MGYQQITLVMVGQKLTISQRRACLVRIGMQDRFGESGTTEELLRKHGLDAEGIAAAVQRRLDGTLDYDV